LNSTTPPPAFYRRRGTKSCQALLTIARQTAVIPRFP
jgi:hypothetical protein